MNGTILVVDDSADLRTLLVRFIEGLGFAAVEAKNGLAALEFLRAHSSPVLILLDSEMDVMNGREFLEAFAESFPALLRLVPVVVLSGTAGFTHPRIFRALKKPVDLDKLESTITDAIQQFGATGSCKVAAAN